MASASGVLGWIRNCSYYAPDLAHGRVKFDPVTIYHNLLLAAWFENPVCTIDMRC